MAAAGRFDFVSDRTVENVRKVRHTTWSTNVYNAWVKERNQQSLKIFRQKETNFRGFQI